MFFPDRIKSVNQNDRVLEIGPGGNAHPRADVLLEKIFKKPEETEAQRGFTSELNTDKPIVFYNGGKFPFVANEFDYVICSHVLEHVDDVEFFLSELTRVANKGYIEFPTIYYDYIYNIPKHLNFLFYNDASRTIYYLPKTESEIMGGKEIQKFFFKTTFKGYVSLIDSLRDFMFQGFEWSDGFKVEKATGTQDLVYDLDSLEIPEYTTPSPLATLSHSLKRKVFRFMSKLRGIRK